MPQKKTGKKRSDKSLGDITLNDFANSTICKNRLKKSTSNVNKVLKKFEEEKSWDEKTDEFEGDFVPEEDEEGNVTFVIRKSENRRRRKTVSSSEDIKPSEGNDYPIDIWYLISEYIRPEDVGRFAGICKTSFEVVCTGKFWFRLYRKYYTATPTLPEELQPECLVRKYGLRTAVIRALYHMYPPFSTKLKSLLSIVGEQHPDVLKNRICETMWYYQRDGKWCYTFKLRSKSDNQLQHSGRSTAFSGPDLLEILDDVSANPDEHCRVLQVTCKHFIKVPLVAGQVLTSVSQTLSAGFRYHRIQLGFGSGIISTSGVNNPNTTSIILDPVLNYKILDWWHPQYPNSHKLEHLLNRD